MATTDVERLVVSLEASITKYERTMSKALGVTNNTMRKIEQRQTSAIQKIDAGWTGLQRGIATAFASAAALRGATQLIDASTRIENSLKVSGLAGEDLAKVYDQLYASAQRNFAPLESLATLYGRAAQVQKELGASSEDLVKFTDNIAIALRLQGGDAQAASGALLQLGQALGSARVFAEEFNSINEGARPILQAAAAGIEEAGGSVAKLKQLVIDGKVSNQAFFQGIQAGAVVLEEKLAGAEITVSQSFVRLQNVLTDVAGKLNDGTGASALLASGLDNLADGAAEFGTWLEQNGDGVAQFFSDVSIAIDEVQRAGQKFGRDTGLSAFGRFVEDLTGLKVSSDYATGSVKRVADAVDDLTGGATEADLAVAEAEQALVNFAANTKGQFGELQPVVDDFIQQLLEGRGNAQLASEAIDAIGEAGDFGGLTARLGEVVSALFSVRSEAAATAAQVAAATSGRSSADNIAEQRAEQLGNKPKVAPKAVSLDDYPVLGSGGAKGGGKSPVERFSEALAAQERETQALQKKAALLAQLNPLVNDYGYSIERLNAQLELENAAAEAGLQLTPERQAQIAQLSEGYAQATSAAARLAEQQDRARQSAEELAQAGRDALDTIIDGFLEGKDAGEIFGNVLKDLGRNLLNMGLNGLFSGGGIGGIFSGLFGGRGFAAGTANTGGARGQPRGIVHGQEAVIPLPSGGNVPVDIRMPSMPSAASGGGEIRVIAEMQVIDGNLVPVVTRISGQIAGQQVKAYDRQLPNRLQDINMRQG